MGRIRASQAGPASAGAHPSRGLVLAALFWATLAVPCAAQWGRESPGRSGPDLPADFALGLEVTTALARSIGFVDDDAWLERLNDIGYRVASVTGDDTHYSFAILDLPEPNAIALPGGFLMVTRGMMAIDITDDELAHLLGHEISHVQLGHHARAARVNTVISLARTALLVGVLMGARDAGGSRERVVVSDDPGRRDWAVGLTGPEALVQASSLFGGVLQALLESGYSRRYEFEADAGGQRLAVWAGYSPEAGVELLERLHERSFEGNRYSYWRTHPYFEDRVARARVRVTRHRPPREFPDDTAYRQRQALFFAQAAEGVSDEEQALQLFRRAQWCEPAGIASLATGLSLVRFKERREGRVPPILRRHGPLIAAYDSLIARAESTDPEWPELEQARAEREALARKGEELLPEYERALSLPDAPTQLLRRFAENYPRHERASEARYRLGLHLALGGRAAEAVDELLPLLGDARAPAPTDGIAQARTDSAASAWADGAASAWADSAASAWADSAAAALLLALPELDDLSVCHRIQAEASLAAAEGPAAAVARAARLRLDELVAGDLPLEQGGRYLSLHPNAPWSDAVRRKVEARAQQVYLTGRVQEGMQRYQEALDAYFEVLAFARESPAAAQAAEGAERINRLEPFE
ncbi:MAG: M48 family metalloprotease [Candidatus Eisenbacteria bacterium]|uniref:M48 family metalloprotease n=1 Tax=Eiseniibacteriota bacterium TaxID=2212470 RepID=A0A938BPJ8_UNCEI|nr:M48 family metalloprotease [Candidatus Eisenbacteria bacterium]